MLWYDEFWSIAFTQTFFPDYVQDIDPSFSYIISKRYFQTYFTPNSLPCCQNWFIGISGELKSFVTFGQIDWLIVQHLHTSYE